MPDDQNKPQKPGVPKGGKPDPSQQRTTIILVVVLLMVAVFVGAQFMNMGAGQTTDTLETGEFVQALEQDRVTSVTYAASDYTVNGKYYPVRASPRRSIRPLTP